MDKMRIGIYGGTFNPIHYGHLRTAEEVRERMSLDKILFIPAGRTPFVKPEMVIAIHRFNMVNSAISGNPHFQISDVEMKAKGKSFTIDTIMKLKKQFSGSDLSFILGIDAFLDLPHWKQPDRLVNLADLVVISRPGLLFSDLRSSPYLKKVPAKALRDIDSGIISIIPFNISERQKGFLCKVTALEISASNIRNLITTGQNIKYLLPDSVESYIISNNLYKSHSKSGLISPLHKRR